MERHGRGLWSVCANPSPAQLQEDVDVFLVFKEPMELDNVFVVQGLVYLNLHCHLWGRGGQQGEVSGEGRVVMPGLTLSL